jgi:hypothetical protein
MLPPTPPHIRGIDCMVNLVCYFVPDGDGIAMVEGITHSIRVVREYTT